MRYYKIITHKKQLMDINNLKYVIFDYSEVNKIDFSQVRETSINTLRVSVDGTKTFVKWIGDEPSSVSSLISKSNIFNNEDMIVILSQPEWNDYTTISGSTQ